MGQLVSKKRRSAVSEENRGSQLKRKKIEWIKEDNFATLNEDGQKAFKLYTKFMELNKDTRRLEFWFAKAEDEKLSALLSDYLSIICNLKEVHEGTINVNDIYTQISDHNQSDEESAENDESDEVNIDQINDVKVQKVLKSAVRIDKWIDKCVSLLKDEMRDDLNVLFEEFKKALTESRSFNEYLTKEFSKG